MRCRRLDCLSTFSVTTNSAAREATWLSKLLYGTDHSTAVKPRSKDEQCHKLLLDIFRLLDENLAGSPSVTAADFLEMDRRLYQEVLSIVSNQFLQFVADFPIGLLSSANAGDPLHALMRRSEDLDFRFVNPTINEKAMDLAEVARSLNHVLAAETIPYTDGDVGLDRSGKGVPTDTPHQDEYDLLTRKVEDALDLFRNRTREFIESAQKELRVS